MKLLKSVFTFIIFLTIEDTKKNGFLANVVGTAYGINSRWYLHKLSFAGLIKLKKKLLKLYE